MELKGPFIDNTMNELFIPVVREVGNEHRKVLMSVAVDMEPADTALILAQLEVTNNLNANVGFGRYVIRAKTPLDTFGTMLVPANMDNITPDMHHKSEDFWAIDTGATGRVYYNIIAYAVTSHAPGHLIVQQGYGKLVVLQFKL